MAAGRTIMNPGVPACIAVDGGICPGSMIVIQGVAPHPPARFAINLQAGYSTTDPRPTTSIHFNPRFDMQNVVRNHFEKGAWGREELNGGFPFQNGQQFEVILLVESESFKFAVNGKHYCEFRHRVRKETCNYLRIDGDVKINYIRFQGGYVQPPRDMSAAHFPVYPPAGHGQPPVAGAPIYNPPVPFKMSIPGAMYPGRMISVSGIVHSTPERFHINLSCGAYPNADIAFHFNPRFFYGSDSNIVVRNHFQAGSWGPEERHQNHFPFTPGAAFDLIILVEPSCIKVAVNNKHFLEFNHRIIPLNRIDTLDIDGHLRLTMVHIQ